MTRRAGLLALTAAFLASSAPADMPVKPRVRAPELDGGLGWVNTSKPIRLADLRGKIVLLDFWAYCCINCMHVVPDLKRLEADFPDDLVVLGVHSAKFPNERDTANVREAALRFGITHPVLNDGDMRLWDAYAVQGWPTFVLIDPDGYVIYQEAGEGHYQELKSLIAKTAADFKAAGRLDETPKTWDVEKAPDGPLSFPGKVAADGKRLFIADSGHDRILVSELSGKISKVIGGGKPGRDDGAFSAASFNDPQGLALVDGALYIADTGNHLIRKADLKTREVSTVAGSGNQLRFDGSSGPALSTALSSPWDLLAIRGKLYIAMAGSHQIWRLDFKTGVIGPWAGNGNEDLRDGSLSAASFAQPSGLATDGRSLFVADSEASAIQTVALDDIAAPGGPSRQRFLAREPVRTLVGGGLFEFGDAAGARGKAKLQHPVGLAYHAGKLYIADTYNHRIKTLDPSSGKVADLAGTGKAGAADGEQASFYEPSGLAFAADSLYVADTDNNAVRRVDLKSGRVSTLTIDLPAAAEPAPPAKAAVRPITDLEDAEQVELPSAALRPGPGTLELGLDFAPGWHLNPMAPLRYTVVATDGGISVADGDRVASLQPARLPLVIPVRCDGAGGIRFAAAFYYCREDGLGVCKMTTVLFHQPISTGAGAPATAAVSYKLQ